VNFKETPTMEQSALPSFDEIEDDFNEKFMQGVLEIVFSEQLAESTTNKLLKHFENMAQESKDILKYSFLQTLFIVHLKKVYFLS
jgi:hypothetical protein